MTQIGSGTDAKILKVLINSDGKGLRVEWDAWVCLVRLWLGGWSRAGCMGRIG